MSRRPGRRRRACGADLDGGAYSLLDRLVPNRPNPQVLKILRPVYFAFGCLCVVLGIIGIFVPLMPTTTFLILAAWCFARSSRRAEEWLLKHPRFGPTIVAWRENGAIARRHKLYSLGGMALGFALFFITAKPDLWLALVVAAALGAIAVFVVTRPEPAPEG